MLAPGPAGVAMYGFSRPDCGRKAGPIAADQGPTKSFDAATRPRTVQSSDCVLCCRNTAADRGRTEFPLDSRIGCQRWMIRQGQPDPRKGLPDAHRRVMNGGMTE